MIRALFFKEWLKIRWAVLAMLGLFLLAVVIIALNLSYDLRVRNANGYWYNVIIRQMIFYNLLAYIPSLAGIVIGITQFYPELSARRLKLTLHLPLPENKILFTMISFGVSTILLLYVLVYVILRSIIECDCNNHTMVPGRFGVLFCSEHDFYRTSLVTTCCINDRFCAFCLCLSGYVS